MGKDDLDYRIEVLYISRKQFDDQAMLADILAEAECVHNAKIIEVIPVRVTRAPDAIKLEMKMQCTLEDSPAEDDKRTNPFSVPEGYFSKLTESIKSKIKSTKGRGGVEGDE